jgi:aminoacyl tRNA synthase complex-interacting multifunctional protein 1
VDLSAEQTDSRTIVSGLVPYMSKESLQVIRFLYTTKLKTNRSCIKQDRNVIVVSNLKASKFRGVLSQGMLLAASLENKVETLSPPSTATLGERVQLEGITLGEAVDVLKPKQKILEQVVQYLKTNQNGIATYKGIPLVTSQGPVSCDIKHGQIS